MLGPGPGARPRGGSSSRGTGRHGRRALDQRPGIPRDDGSQRHARPRLLSRGPPGRRRDHPERAEDSDKRRRAARAHSRAVAADSRRRQAPGRPRRPANQRAHVLSRRGAGPKGPEPDRLSRPEDGLCPEGEARRPRLSDHRRLRPAGAGRLGRQGRIQPRALSGNTLRQVLRDRRPVRHLPAAGERPGRCLGRRLRGRPARPWVKAHGRARDGPPAHDDRGRPRRRNRAAGREGPAQQRLVRGPRPRAGRED